MFLNHATYFRQVQYLNDYIYSRPFSAFIYGKFNSSFYVRFQLFFLVYSFHQSKCPIVAFVKYILPQLYNHCTQNCIFQFFSFQLQNTCKISAVTFRAWCIVSKKVPLPSSFGLIFEVWLAFDKNKASNKVKSLSFIRNSVAEIYG